MTTLVRTFQIDAFTVSSVKAIVAEQNEQIPERSEVDERKNINE